MPVKKKTKRSSRAKPAPEALRGQDNVKTLFCDYVAISLRTDDNAMIRFGTNLPEGGTTEECRVVLPRRILKKMSEIAFEAEQRACEAEKKAGK